MKFRHAVLLIMLIFEIYIKDTSANVRKCYQCRSDVDSRCEDIKTDMFLKVCDKNSSTLDINIDSNVCQRLSGYYCRKTSQTLKFLDRKPKTIILRECTQFVRPNRDKECVMVTDPDHFYAIICECKTDGCNKSPQTRTISWLIAFLLFLRVFFPP